ncbi:hypothetical protein LUX57_38940 [Actinomadura madurae]|nr:hypothetical protein [Actinomadura madurae]MCP9970424.1 hypothetical protein [Actinomadura madurae]
MKRSLTAVPSGPVSSGWVRTAPSRTCPGSPAASYAHTMVEGVPANTTFSRHSCRFHSRVSSGVRPSQTGSASSRSRPRGHQSARARSWQDASACTGPSPNHSAASMNSMPATVLGPSRSRSSADTGGATTATTASSARRPSRRNGTADSRKSCRDPYSRARCANRSRPASGPRGPATAGPPPAAPVDPFTARSP